MISLETGLHLLDGDAVHPAIFAIGLLGQGLFFVRFLIQWLLSEKAKRIIVPNLFWWLSLFGALFALIYAYAEKNLVFLAGPAVNLFVYLRNLNLTKSRRRLGKTSIAMFGLGLLLLTVLALAAVYGLTLEVVSEAPFLRWQFASDANAPHANDPLLWLLIGGFGQALWMLRFPLQWWFAEHRGETTLPTIFFDVSLLGSVFLLAYALHTGKVVFILGMILTPILYARTAWISHRQQPEAGALAPDQVPPKEPVSKEARS